MKISVFLFYASFKSPLYVEVSHYYKLRTFNRKHNYNSQWNETFFYETIIIPRTAFVSPRDVEPFLLFTLLYTISSRKNYLSIIRIRTRVDRQEINSRCKRHFNKNHWILLRTPIRSPFTITTLHERSLTRSYMDKTICLFSKIYKNAPMKGTCEVITISLINYINQYVLVSI